MASIWIHHSRIEERHAGHMSLAGPASGLEPMWGAGDKREPHFCLCGSPRVPCSIQVLPEENVLQSLTFLIFDSNKLYQWNFGLTLATPSTSEDLTKFYFRPVFFSEKHLLPIFIVNSLTAPLCLLRKKRNT